MIVEPLARSTGHQTWFASKLVKALIDAGFNPTLITFDGMNDEADLEFRNNGYDVRRILPLAPRWVRWAFGKLTGIAPGSMAKPSAVRWRFQIYLYNQLATVISTIYSVRSVCSGQAAVLHLLCPPSWPTLWCFQAARRAGTTAVITTFGAPCVYRGGAALRRRLCKSKAATILVQTEALASDWSRDVGSSSVRTIPMPSGDSVRPKDPQECRRLLGLPLDKPIVAVIGCMAPQKGYIELYHALRGAEKNFRILLIGDTPSWISPDPETVAEQCGWLDHTIYQNRFVTEAMWPLLLGAVNVVALLYREPNASSGILSLCQQYGVPVLATRFGELGAKVRSENLGLTADPNDPEEVTAALIRILGSGDNRDAQTGGDRKHTCGGTVETDAAPSWADVASAHLRLYAALQKTTLNECNGTVSSNSRLQ